LPCGARSLKIFPLVSLDATMAGENPNQTRDARPVFTEAGAWRDVGAGWQPLFGSFRAAGFSVEWHDFQARRELDWAASFHPGCLELCLNLEGNGVVETGSARTEFFRNTAGFYHRGESALTATRASGQRHQFLTVEYSTTFLASHLSGAEATLHPLVRGVLGGKSEAFTSGNTVRLNAAQLQIISTLRQPPIYSAAQPVWYQCKALELAVTFLVKPEAELFCTRQQRLAQERVEQVIYLLKKNLADPPSLEALGKQIGCSHFYLSRIFSAQTGQTITQHLRALRMERAAELLKTREYNVTEVALEVGYNSLSHFSAAFQETHGCCPGLYPLATSTQKSAGKN
jgi:AraC-like DNA-binding protein